MLFRSILDTHLDAAAEAASSSALAIPVPGLRVDRVQPEGRGPMALDDFVRGARLVPGERFS